MRLVATLLACLLALAGICQPADGYVILSFKPMLAGKPLVIDSTYLLPNGQAVRIHELKFYISNVELCKGPTCMYAPPAAAHLISSEPGSANSIRIKVGKNVKFNAITFNLGIDSLTNAGGARGGDLDPTKNMYWAWHSGYINAKIEGWCNQATSADSTFQFHLGGFQAPFNSIQQVRLRVQKAPVIPIYLVLDSLLSGVHFNTVHHIMSPGARSVAMLKSMAGGFTAAKP